MSSEIIRISVDDSTRTLSTEIDANEFLNHYYADEATRVGSDPTPWGWMLADIALHMSSAHREMMIAAGETPPSVEEILRGILSACAKELQAPKTIYSGIED